MIIWNVSIHIDINQGRQTRWFFYPAPKLYIYVPHFFFPGPKLYTLNMFYKKRSKNLASPDFDFLYSCFLILMTHFG